MTAGKKVHEIIMMKIMMMPQNVVGLKHWAHTRYAAVLYKDDTRRYCTSGVEQKQKQKQNAPTHLHAWPPCGIMNLSLADQPNAHEIMMLTQCWRNIREVLDCRITLTL